VEWEDDDGLHGESIEAGLCILAGAAAADTPEQVSRLAGKVAALRIFADGEGKFNRSITDVGGSALVISQFTLFADLSRGRRPSFLGAGDPPAAAAAVDRFAAELAALGVPTRQGRFGAHMVVTLANDGPVTIVLSTDEWPTRV
jgi:D-tyrosyl-tRNA(Tyr) deacylase